MRRSKVRAYVHTRSYAQAYLKQGRREQREDSAEQRGSPIRGRLRRQRSIAVHEQQQRRAKQRREVRAQPAALGATGVPATAVESEGEGPCDGGGGVADLPATG